MTYGVQVYNARLDPVTRHPALEESIQVFRDGRQVIALHKAFVGHSQTSLGRFSFDGNLQLGADLKPGDYMFQVIATEQTRQVEIRDRQPVD
ncbi:MAG: hypothetical protein ACLQOO_12700 [Terriglobia bacterium]